METCENCGNPLTEISERHIINHYHWDGNGYVLVDTSYDASEYFCGNCGAEIQENNSKK